MNFEKLKNYLDNITTKYHVPGADCIVYKEHEMVFRHSVGMSDLESGKKEFILKLLEDYPDSAEMLEYEDYVKEPTKANASEFISRALEDNAHTAIFNKTYADYIATRPGVEKHGSHGLFTNLDENINLTKVSEELNNHGGNVWTVIISIRREDAIRLSYDKGEAWQNLLRKHSEKPQDFL